MHKARILILRCSLVKLFCVYICVLQIASVCLIIIAVVIQLSLIQCLLYTRSADLQAEDPPIADKQRVRFEEWMASHDAKKQLKVFNMIRASTGFSDNMVNL